MASVAVHADGEEEELSVKGAEDTDIIMGATSKNIISVAKCSENTLARNVLYVGDRPAQAAGVRYAVICDG